MNVPGAAQALGKHHQITGAEPHRLPAIGGDRHISLQQQTGLLLVVVPGEGADATGPDRPTAHPQALQLGCTGLVVTLMALAMAGLDVGQLHCRRQP